MQTVLRLPSDVGDDDDVSPLPGSPHHVPCEFHDLVALCGVCKILFFFLLLLLIPGPAPQLSLRDKSVAADHALQYEYNIAVAR